ncbi:MAG: hypothetical protein AAFR24_13935 [Cyanobacteria bacterium J06627_3]
MYSLTALFGVKFISGRRRVHIAKGKATPRSTASQVSDVGKAAI